MKDDKGQPAPFFYGLQPRWLSWDRLYRIYVSDKMVAGAYIAGQIYDEQSATVQLQQMRSLLRPIVRRRLAQRCERETLYDAHDPFGPSFLGHDARNFQILRSDVAQVRFRRNRSLRTRFNVGSVELLFLDGSTNRLILVGDQDPGTVMSLMQVFDAAMEVTGKPNPLPRPKPISATRKRTLLLRLAGLFICFGALFVAVAVAGVASNPAYIPIAVVNALAGGWCLLRAWRIPLDSPAGASRCE